SSSLVSMLWNANASAKHHDGATVMQTTLRGDLAFEGIGLHTGARAAMRIRPAEPGSGLTFVLSSGKAGGSVRVPATSQYVTDTSRATAIGRNGASVSTIEHVLSALFGMGISNADIEVQGPEIPVLDGSSKMYAEAIAGIGALEQAVARREIALEAPFELRRGERAVIVLPAPDFCVRFIAEFPAPVGTQYFYGAIDPRTYIDEIASARTFGYLHEVEALRERGLALGGNLENALVFDADGPMQPLRWPNEVVRHKVLDLIGDFALLGAWPRCEIIAIKSGHELHALVTQALRERYCG
ncbi:MAG: UDP-3-O-acyl-N-acetylglucosamine deacetylase, partial [Vulcanimicrobiaceae bacterium]